VNKIRDANSDDASPEYICRCFQGFAVDMIENFGTVHEGSSDIYCRSLLIPIYFSDMTYYKMKLRTQGKSLIKENPTVIVSSPSYLPPHLPEREIDGRMDTFWHQERNKYNASLMIDFGYRATVTKIEVTTRRG
jgi:hypothetical protein